MGKRKKKKATATSTPRGFGKTSLRAGIQRVQAYGAKEDWQAAYEVLQVLTEQYPQEKQVWEYLADVSYELQNFQAYQKASEKILEFTPRDADTLYGLGGLYAKHVYPLLALQTMERALAVDPDHDFAPRARELVNTLRPQVPELLTQIGLDDFEVAILQERGQACLSQGDYAAAREVALEVIQRSPKFVAAHNNLALANWAEGRMEDAIATTRTVLNDYPDNVHALANLIHFLVVTGDREAAQVYGERLKTTQEKAWDSWTKRVEGLSFLADDPGIVEVLDQAIADGVEQSSTGALFFHLTAVALARTGDQARAVKQWKKALKRDPTLTLAQENLTDIRRPVGQRHGAWPWNFQRWLLPTTAAAVYSAIQKTADQEPTEDNVAAMVELFEDHADLKSVLPRILERGGPLGQQFGLLIAPKVKTSELLTAIKDFALGPNGTDKMRYQAASIAADAGLIPRDKVTLWVQGEQREIMLLAYEIHSEPSSNHAQAVTNLLIKATKKLYQRNQAEAVKAEALLKQALALEPGAPDLLNNLATAYILQNRKAEADAIVDDIIERCPDYLFARCAKASRYLDVGDIDAASDLLKPMLSRNQFHISEFVTFSDTYVRLLLKKDETDGARIWLQMWENADPDNPAIAYWKAKVELKSKTQKFLNLFSSK